jgi:hypothetical protein
MLNCIRKFKLISKIILLMIFVFSIVTDCKKNDAPYACGIDHPVENLPWLKEFSTILFCEDVYKFSYINVEYVIISTCELASHTYESVYTCDGTRICQHGGTNGNCPLPSEFWVSYYKDKILIYQIRNYPEK